MHLRLQTLPSLLLPLPPFFLYFSSSSPFSFPQTMHQLIMTPKPAFPILDFRIPPPSPVAPGRRSSFVNDDVLTEYLHQSLKVPDLVLRTKSSPATTLSKPRPSLIVTNWIPWELGIAHLVAQLGCLELINHGIPRDLIEFVLELGNAVFQIPLEKKRAVTRLLERRYGFEEVHDEDQIQQQIKGDECEDFVWSAEEAMQVEMEGLWPFRYSNFRHNNNILHSTPNVISLNTLALNLPFLVGKWKTCRPELGISGRRCFNF